MRVVIAGGHGKIALMLERLLAERSDQAVGLIRNPAHVADVRKAGADAVICDLEAASAGEGLRAGATGLITGGWPGRNVISCALAGSGCGPGEADVAVLHTEPYDDIATRVQADSRPWRPVPAGSAASPYAVTEPRDDHAVFSVVDLATGKLAGEALLWAIDLHDRTAHLGLSLRPAFRGRGLRTDVVVAPCRYGLAVCGLHCPQVDTLASKKAMSRSASRAGFVHEGRLRGAAWANGEFAGEVILGMLATDWTHGGTHVNGPG
jgi:RimJ/RimL family protein N-acetyltransferase